MVKALKFKVQPKPFKIGGHFGGTYRYIHLLSVIIPIIESCSLQKPSSSFICCVCDIRTGQRYQLEIYRQAVTALVVNERIEMVRHKGMMVSFLCNFIVFIAFTYF